MCCARRRYPSTLLQWSMIVKNQLNIIVFVIKSDSFQSSSGVSSSTGSLHVLTVNTSAGNQGGGSIQEDSLDDSPNCGKYVFWLSIQNCKGELPRLHTGLRYKGWDVISEVHQLVVFPPTYFRRETGLVAYPRLKYLTPPLSVKIHLIFIIF